MLRRDKNAFLQAITRQRLDPAMFNASEEERYGSYYSGTPTLVPAFVVELVGTPLQFWMTREEKSYKPLSYEFVHFAPVRITTRRTYLMRGTLTIDKILTQFDGWLRDHVRPYIAEMNTPDLWAMGLQEHEILDSPLDIEDVAFFSAREKAAIRIAVASFRQQLLDVFEPAEEELKMIDRRLEYLTNAVDRLNKFDWKSLWLSTIISVATSLSLDTERGRMLFELAKQAFSSALHLLR